MREKQKERYVDLILSGLNVLGGQKEKQEALNSIFGSEKNKSNHILIRL